MEVKLIAKTEGDAATLSVNAARISFNKKIEPPATEKDYKLIEFLVRNKHFTPNAHAHYTFHITAPIFVARQLIKHQVGGVWSEMSRRYVDGDLTFYTPDEWRQKAEDKKQGSGDSVDAEKNVDCLNVYQEGVWAAERAYKLLLHMGACPEQARMVLPQSLMTEWYWTGSLEFWNRVCRQRLHHTAQKETAIIAQKISDALAEAESQIWLIMRQDAEKQNIMAEFLEANKTASVEQLRQILKMV